MKGQVMKTENTEQNIIDENKIYSILHKGSKYSSQEILDILKSARDLKGLNMDSVSALMTVEDETLLNEIFKTAKEIKNKIYGQRLVIFAPLYVSNLCNNECTYCAFRAGNKNIKRVALTQEQIQDETLHLINEGHKRVLLVAGESYPQNKFEYILHAVDSVYKTKHANGEIRRVNVNIAPLDLAQFKELKKRDIGTYQLFQETYHKATYKDVHTKGKKADYDYRLTAMDRAIEAGIDDVGIGVLFGLYDWKFEVLALLQHTQHLENKFGVGPHTISVPRIEPAGGSSYSLNPENAVSDSDFKKLIAILRIAVPYTGIIMSTRENSELRSETFALGVSQISAGSRTNPGGYSDENADAQAQFSLGDHRCLDEVIKDIASMGYFPSFCTGCYRLGRTGADFMDLAKPGDIRNHCDPNAISTFMEYLMDYASDETKSAGLKAIEKACKTMEPIPAQRSRKFIEKIKSGERDVYC
ncbi:MAG: [FeFe] hydrogenase H-cluster radical SAM maturase HydG [Deltaproteobacteria bacterium]|nr:[FeFe] hydrogenase H-cluster radical SAM maturase HydG [Deltaproteobacteria bacterium]